MDEDERTLLAAEFALGLLSEAESRAASGRIGEDAELRDELRLWEARLAAIAEADVAGARPPGRVLDRTCDDLFGATAPRRSRLRRALSELRAPGHRRVVTMTLIFKAAIVLGLLSLLLLI